VRHGFLSQTTFELHSGDKGAHRVTHHPEVGKTERMGSTAPDVVIRRLTADDGPAAQAFASRVPQGERAFIDRSLLGQVFVAGWTQPTRARRTGAFLDGAMVAIMTVDPQPGWMSHVGELRLVVLPEARGRGIATALADRAVAIAGELQLSKLYVEVLASLTAVIDMFTSLGFVQEALLRGHVTQGDGVPGDLAILSRFVGEGRGQD
jgi:ribosomal protein S18 acetylase RimI-like enzyme